MEIETFSPDHLTMAAKLLALRHAVDAGRDPRLPTRFTDPKACLPLIATLLGRGRGLAAFEGGGMVGYLVATLPGLHETHRSAFIGLAGHALAQGADTEIYRELYAVLAPVLLRRGVFDHQAFIASLDEAASDAWFSLGFGQVEHVACRGLEDVVGPSADVSVHVAGLPDLDDVMRLLYGLVRHNTTSPMFAPYIFDQSAWRSAIEKQLQQDDRTFLLAKRSGRAAGVMYVGQAQPAMFRPDGAGHLWEAFVDEHERGNGIGTTLLRQCVAWCRDKGLDSLTLDFRTFNRSGADFWRRHGFRPIATLLERRIDPRIAWADGTNE